MKKKFLISLIAIWSLYNCDSSKIIVKSSYYEGKSNELKRYNEYNTKSKKIITIINGVKTEKKISLKPADKKYFKSLVSKLKLNNNFCFKSLNTYPEYIYKYEIILNEKEIMPECEIKPVNNIFYETYNSIKDTIKKRSDF